MKHNYSFTKLFLLIYLPIIVYELIVEIGDHDMNVVFCFKLQIRNSGYTYATNMLYTRGNIQRLNFVVDDQ